MDSWPCTRHWVSRCSRCPTGTRPQRRNSRPPESRRRPLGVARPAGTPAHWGRRRRSRNRSERYPGKPAVRRARAKYSGGARRRAARRSPRGKARQRTRRQGNQHSTHRCRARRRRHFQSRPWRRRPPRWLRQPRPGCPRIAVAGYRSPGPTQGWPLVQVRSVRPLVDSMVAPARAPLEVRGRPPRPGARQPRQRSRSPSRQPCVISVSARKRTRTSTPFGTRT